MRFLCQQQSQLQSPRHLGIFIQELWTSNAPAQRLHANKKRRSKSKGPKAPARQQSAAPVKAKLCTPTANSASTHQFCSRDSHRGLQRMGSPQIWEGGEKGGIVSHMHGNCQKNPLWQGMPCIWTFKSGCQEHLRFTTWQQKHYTWFGHDSCRTDLRSMCH